MTINWSVTNTPVKPKTTEKRMIIICGVTIKIVASRILNGEDVDDYKLERHEYPG